MADEFGSGRGVVDGRDVDREVLGLLAVANVVVHDQEVVATGDLGVLHRVFDALDAWCDTAEFTRRIGGVEHEALGRDLRSRHDHQVLVAARGTHANPVPLVGLVEYLDVVGARPDVVAPHRIRTPCGVDRLIEHVLGVERPRRPARGVGDDVGKQVAGLEVLEPQRVSLVTDDVGAVCEPLAVVTDG